MTGDLPSPLDTRAQLMFLKSRLIDDPDAEQYRPKLIEVAPGHFVAEHDPVDSLDASDLVDLVRAVDRAYCSCR